MYVLRAQVNVAPLDRFGHGGDVGEGNADDDVAIRILDERFESIDEFRALRRGVVHFPVACNDGFSHNDRMTSLQNKNNKFRMQNFGLILLAKVK